MAAGGLNGEPARISRKTNRQKYPRREVCFELIIPVNEFRKGEQF